MDGRKSLSSEYPRPSVFTPFLRRFTDERARDVSETIDLYNEVRRAHFASMWAHQDAIEHVNTVIAKQVGETVDLPTFSALLKALDRCQQEVLTLERTIFSFPEIDLNAAVLSLKEHVDLRRFLRAKQHFLSNDNRISDLLAVALGSVCAGWELPESSLMSLDCICCCANGVFENSISPMIAQTPVLLLRVISKTLFAPQAEADP